MLYATVRQRKVFVKKPTAIVRNSVNVDRLVLEMDDEWAAMTSIKCVFCLQYTEDKTTKEIAKEILHTFGNDIEVPWECLTQTGKLSISCVGYVEDTQIMRTMKADSFWDVVQEGADTGDEPLEATPTLYDQVIAAAGAANSAATQAASISADLAEKRDSGYFNGKDGLTPVVEIGTVQTGSEGSEAQVNNTGTFPNLKLNFVLPRGASGRDGVPGRDGEPGRDGIDGRDGSPGQPGRDGVDGRDGKDGNPGHDGEDGRGITEIVDNDNGTWTIRFSDDTTQTVRPPAPIEGGDVVPGEDGGYYIPKVENGVLSWTPSKVGMPEAKSENVQGSPGKDGEPGKDGASVTVASVTESTEDGGTNVVRFSDGNQLNIKNGKSGNDGEPGYTPQKGTDYFTEADKEEIARQAAGMVDVPSGSWNDLKDKPSAFPPEAHNQAASTITAGTFAGEVVANASGQAASSYVVRNSKLSSTEEAPTVNGQICWKYE